MIFEEFKRFRKERPDEAAFLISAGDRSVPVSWRRFTDDIATVCWIIEKHAPASKIALLGENSYEWMVAHAACLFSGAVAVPVETGLANNKFIRILSGLSAGEEVMLAPPLSDSVGGSETELAKEGAAEEEAK